MEIGHAVAIAIDGFVANELRILLEVGIDVFRLGPFAGFGIVGKVCVAASFERIGNAIAIAVAILKIGLAIAVAIDGNRPRTATCAAFDAIGNRIAIAIEVEIIGDAVAVGIKTL